MNVVERAVLLASITFSLAACKEVTEAVVEKGVKVAKDTTKGIEEGIAKGRKEGESTDGAQLVSGAAELTGKGTMTVRALRPSSVDPKQSDVELAFENTTDRPLRLTKLDPMALDKEAFTKKPVAPPGELTVPPRAKERLVLTFDAEASALSKVRIWGVDSALPAAEPARPAGSAP